MQPNIRTAKRYSVRVHVMLHTSTCKHTHRTASAITTLHRDFTSCHTHTNTHTHAHTHTHANKHAALQKALHRTAKRHCHAMSQLHNIFLIKNLKKDIFTVNKYISSTQEHVSLKKIFCMHDVWEKVMIFLQKYTILSIKLHHFLKYY